LEEKILIQKGKSKNVYQDNGSDRVILEFKDSDGRFDGETKAKFEEKGSFKSLISGTVFDYLSGYNIPTHLIKMNGGRELIAKKLEMIPIDIYIYNYAVGRLSKNFKLKSGMPLKYPVIEYYLKEGEMAGTLIAESHAYAFEYASPDEMKHISRLATKVNAVLKAFFERRKLQLINFKLEFGRHRNQLYLGDEFTPDISRIWKIENGKADKSYFKYDKNNTRNSYEELTRLITGA
jgi:phosphoribosylaminoimidazole-succinocarboxamide synthase